MKKAFLFLGAMAICASAVFAQDEKKEKEDEGYKFDTIKVLPITSVKNQNNAGTCWSYSGIAFLESEPSTTSSTASATTAWCPTR